MTVLSMNRKHLQKLNLDLRHAAKHLVGTPESERILFKEGAAHVFNDEATMNMVIETIRNHGTFIGLIRGHERWGYKFDKPVGYRTDITGKRVPLYYGEMKIRGDKYHVIPRTGPSR